jgi:anti-sigma regulatory factor (Ser/Thr protein kinase)
VRHGVFIYDEDDAMVGSLAPFLKAGVSEGEPGIVVLERRKLDLLADALGPEGDMVAYVDCDAFYTRPEDVLARYDLRIRQLTRDGASAVRGFAELPPRPSEADIDSWVRYEAIVNRALAHHPLWIICGYDRREMPKPLLETALETHQEVLADDWAPSGDYRSPEAVVRSRTPRPVPLVGLRPVPLAGGPRMFRERLTAEVRLAGMTESDGADLAIAAGEVLANAQEHGGEHVSVQVGQVDGQFVCEVSDGGSGLDDPLAGFVPPRPGTSDGAGLWVARQLTRRLEFVRTPERFTVRLSVGPAL